VTSPVSRSTPTLRAQLSFLRPLVVHFPSIPPVFLAWPASRLPPHTFPTLRSHAPHRCRTRWCEGGVAGHAHACGGVPDHADRAGSASVYARPTSRLSVFRFQTLCERPAPTLTRARGMIVLHAALLQVSDC
jgi:hypothetical protein